MENKDNKKANKLHKPIMTAAIFLTIASFLYIVYVIMDMPNKEIDASFIPIAIDVLAMATFAVFAWIVAFDTKKLKLLAIPAFIQAIIIVVSLALIYKNTGFTSEIAYEWFTLSTLAIALALFGLYVQDKDISIVYASIVITLSTAAAVYGNTTELISTFKMESSYLPYYIYPLYLLFAAIGIFILVWICCMYFPQESTKKDIIKKRIWLSVLLSVFTLGIYTVYWVKTITEDIAKLEGSEVNSSVETAMFFIVPLYALYWLYTKGKKTSRLAGDANMGAIYVVQGVFMLCFFAMALMQNQLHIATGIKEK